MDRNAGFAEGYEVRGVTKTLAGNYGLLIVVLSSFLQDLFIERSKAFFSCVLR
jgi:hypothetical protein